MRTFLYSIRDDFIDGVLPFWHSLTVILFVALPQIQKQTKRHQPHLIHSQMEVGDAVIKKSGE